MKRSGKHILAVIALAVFTLSLIQAGITHCPKLRSAFYTIVSPGTPGDNHATLLHSTEICNTGINYRVEEKPAAPVAPLKEYPVFAVPVKEVFMAENHSLPVFLPPRLA